jgi:para-nitrobenzyl esterase
LGSPLAAGLFHRAIIQSGGLGAARPRAEMEEEGVAAAAKLGASGDDALTRLRALPVEALLAQGGPFDANADGWIVPRPGPSGLDSDVPLLVGATTNEAAIFALTPDLKTYQEMVDETGPAWSAQIAGLYPAARDEEALPAMIRLMTERDFVCPARYVAAHRRAPTWLFLFSAPAAETEGGRRMGAFHGADEGMLFDRSYGLPQSATGKRVGDAMRRYWVRFAADGAPNVETLPAWPAYKPSAASYLELGTTIRAQRLPASAACDLFERATYSSAH